MVNKKLVKKKFRVIVHILPKKKFEKEFKEEGKYTQALAEQVNKKSKEGRIYIKKGMSPSRTKQIIQHEVGHAIVDKAELHKRFSKSERKDIRNLAKQLYGKHRASTSHQEDLREGLAWIYERMKSGNPSEKKIIKTEYKRAYEEFKKAKQRLNTRVIKK